MRVELHCHSSASDGALGPADLIAYAHKAEVGVLALTDHDTIAGHAEALASGARIGVRVIPGIEISALSKHGEIHVLGYGVLPPTDALREQIAQLRGAREGRGRAIVARLRELGVEIDFERVRVLAGDAMIGRPYIARVLLEAGHVATIQEAFDRYLAEGKAAHVPMRVLEPGQAVDLIHACGGAAVLAHPGLYACDSRALVRELLPHGLDGVEAHYPKHSPAQTELLAALAREFGLIAAGGSDFHAPGGDAVLGEVTLPGGTLDALLGRMAERAAAIAR